ncbi:MULTISPECIES: helix-turn-helix domain-containing protein [unclassified Mesorhizobium]|uniref:helix-turn-helix transcriptional regulator n=1 Tax=unclassified Mesorhizobium TaxID=325217 RepID=UPI000FCB5295|nr:MULTISPECIES: helix-turn-helix domain-containing protein [unclassified Mesorhizobium]RUW69278.1 DNA-binding protein [Mesorhizobium sp. M4B.F.Ca.ET.049.02.1.2]RVD70777.1 DNA-binding protein [Mesorhizobium sp. M4A.F.Ca.ET.029.04.2.1]TGV26446.1 DNA-binding protein [Mesorhizobium sp. M4B.F.Ca.ET.143.01.1.1]TIW36536.1 MAG: helix-turn-helix domain-containing protein [Mesorhizobium sp.]
MANVRVRQAAEYVGLSKSNLDKMRCWGTGPAYVKLGNSVIYRTEDLDAWLVANRRAANDNGGAARAA